VPDFIWPDHNKAVEVDGIDAHSSPDKLDDGLQRQNQLMDLGLEFRRFSANRVRRYPKVWSNESSDSWKSDSQKHSYPRRPSRMRRKERVLNSSTVSPVRVVASSSEMAPQLMARRK